MVNNSQVLDKKIELLICSLNLPVLDGLTLCKLLKNYSQSRFTPVIVLVDELSGEQEIQERDITVNSYLTIPFDMHKLLFKVDKLISCYRVTKTVFFNLSNHHKICLVSMLRVGMCTL